MSNDKKVAEKPKPKKANRLVVEENLKAGVQPEIGEDGLPTGGGCTGPIRIPTIP